MRKHLIGLVALAFLAIAASTASATTTGINITAPRNNLTTATSVGKVTLAAGIIQNQCNLTLQINVPGGLVAVTSPLTKIARIVAVTATNCDLPTVILNMPATLGGSPAPTWGDIAFTSTDLSNKSRQNITILNAQFSVSGCLFQGNVNGTLTGSIAGSAGVASGADSAGNAINGITGGLCPTSGRLLGSFTLAPTVSYTLLP
jgi:hypothetical protein